MNESTLVRSTHFVQIWLPEEFSDAQRVQVVLVDSQEVRDISVIIQKNDNNAHVSISNLIAGCFERLDYKCWIHRIDVISA